MSEAKAKRNSRVHLLLALALVGLIAAYVVVDLVRNPDTYGTHDWDAQEAFRYYAVDSLRRFKQFPFWDPYSCGGHPFWSGPEMGTILISPLLPVYWLFDLPVAMRIEIVSTLLFFLWGAWLLSGRFSRHPYMRAAACVIGVINSRWAMQIAVGHTWHLYYAWMAWALWAFDHALEKKASSSRWLALAACFSAMMVYNGAIYGLPHTLLLIGLLGLIRALQSREILPLRSAVVTGLLCSLLAAPKLLPMMATFRRFPRLVDSRETIDPISLVRTFISSSADRLAWDFPSLDYGYHEYGIFLGVLPFVLLIAGLVLTPKDPKLRAYRWLALFCFALVLGRAGPWIVLHWIPPFRSQHVPTRFAYPAVLLACLVSIATFERMLNRIQDGRTRKWTQAAIVLFVAVASFDVAQESRRAIAGALKYQPPVFHQTPDAQYRQYFETPPELLYDGVNGPPALGPHRANIGVIRCSTFQGYSHDAPVGPNGLPYELGARGEGQKDYRGEAYLESAEGTETAGTETAGTETASTETASTATVINWSPNRVVVRVTHSAAGDYLVLNQNWDAGWKANGERALRIHDVNGYRLLGRQAEEVVTFEYRPRTLPVALGMLGLGIFVVVLLLGTDPLLRDAASVRGKRTKKTGAIEGGGEPIGSSAR